MVELSDYVSINFMSLAVLGALGLRRLVRMERLHWPRVVLLTCLLWVSVLYLFSLVLPSEINIDYMQFGDESGQYPVTES